jgi:hypothetical protein
LRISSAKITCSIRFGGAAQGYAAGFRPISYISFSLPPNSVLHARIEFFPGAWRDRSNAQFNLNFLIPGEWNLTHRSSKILIKKLR